MTRRLKTEARIIPAYFYILETGGKEAIFALEG
jgi:hypothetical protein